MSRMPLSPVRRLRAKLPPAALSIAFAVLPLSACQSPVEPSRLDESSLREGGYSTGGGYSGSSSGYTSSGTSYSGSGYGGDSNTGTTSGYSTSTGGGGTSYSGGTGGTTWTTSGGGSYSGSTGGTYSGSGGGTTWTSGIGSSYSGSTHYGSYSTTGDGGISETGTTGFSGGAYTDSTSGYGSDTLTQTSTDTTLTTSGTTGEDVWYGVPGGTFLTGIQADAYDNDECSGPTESGEGLVSVCEDAETLKYPSHTTCTDSPVWSTQDCNTWCGTAGKGDGACEAVEGGADRCACQRRTDLGIPADEPGCVAEFSASDQSCEVDAVEFHLATCGEIPDGRTVPEVLKDKRLTNATCSDDSISDEDVNCHDWCEVNAPDPLQFGYCELVESEECGGGMAAKCACTPLIHAVSTLPMGAACWQTYDHADSCDEQSTAFATLKSSCGPDDRVHTFVTQECSDQAPEQIIRDCDDYCPDHLDGVCAGAKDIVCPNGEETQVSSCVCVPKK